MTKGSKIVIDYFAGVDLIIEYSRQIGEALSLIRGSGFRLIKYKEKEDDLSDIYQNISDAVRLLRETPFEVLQYHYDKLIQQQCGGQIHPKHFSLLIQWLVENGHIDEAIDSLFMLATLLDEDRGWRICSELIRAKFNDKSPSVRNWIETRNELSNKKHNGMINSRTLEAFRLELGI